MKLSEAIRAGCEKTQYVQGRLVVKQADGTLCACAIGAAIIGAGCEPDFMSQDAYLTGIERGTTRAITETGAKRSMYDLIDDLFLDNEMHPTRFTLKDPNAITINHGETMEITPSGLHLVSDKPELFELGEYTDPRLAVASVLEQQGY